MLVVLHAMRAIFDVGSEGDAVLSRVLTKELRNILARYPTSLEVSPSVHLRVFYVMTACPA